ncbi:hypothetical protein ACOMHN_049421 [Nucella lapillus]
MNFNGLAGSRRTRRLLRRYPALQDFLDYVRTTYIQAGCLFPPPVWNVFQRNMDQRTNNNVESYHRTLNDAIRTRHPNLWSFIRQLKDHQTLTEEAIFRAERGDAPPPRRRKWRELEERLFRLRQQYNGGERDIQSYWRAVSHCTVNFV